MNSKIFLFASTLLLAKAALAQEQQLSLSEALKLAQQQNKQIQIKSLESKKAEEAIKEQRSFLLPSVSASAAYHIYAERPVIFLRDQSSANKVNAVQVGGTNAANVVLSGNYAILQPAQHSRIRMAQINALAEKERVNDFANSVLLEVARGYYTIQFYKEQKALLQQSLKRNEHALADSRMLLQQGKGLKTDTLRNFIDVQNLKASILSLENKIEVELMHLKQLTGLKGGTVITLVDKLEEVYTETLFEQKDSLVTFATDNRPDIKAQRQMIAFNKEQERAIKAEYKPSLHAIAQYQVQTQSDKFGLSNNDFPRTSFIGLQLNVPIYSGKRQQYRNSIAHYSKHQAILALADLKQTVSVEIHSLLEEMRDAVMQKEIHDKNVEAAQINFNMINERYKHGLSNRLELSDAELILTQAKINRLQAIYGLKTLEVELKRASGLLASE